MSSKMTIVIAAKDPKENQFLSCLYSVAGLEYSVKIDLLIIAGSEIPKIDEYISFRVNSLRIIYQPPAGIYDAYNRALIEIDNGYILFLGSDDLILPEIDNILMNVEYMTSDVIVGRTLMEGRGLTKPRKDAHWLIFNNWCQQGIIYNRSCFDGRVFDTGYPIQADHEFNIYIATSKHFLIEFRDEIIAFFSNEGVSQNMVDWKYREAFPDIVRKYYGSLWGLVSYLKRQIATNIKRHRRIDVRAQLDR